MSFVNHRVFSDISIVSKIITPNKPIVVIIKTNGRICIYLSFIARV